MMQRTPHKRKLLDDRKQIYSKENYDIWFECVIELTFVKEQYDFLNIHSLRFEALETFEFHQSDKILLTNSY